MADQHKCKHKDKHRNKRERNKWAISKPHMKQFGKHSTSQWFGVWIWKNKMADWSGIQLLFKIERNIWINFHIIYFSLRKSLIFFLQLLADTRLEMGRMILNLYFNIFVLVFFYVKLHTSPQCWKCIGIP